MIQKVENTQVAMFQLSEDAGIRRKQQLLQVPEVIQNLSQKDKMIAVASVGKPFKQMERTEVIELAIKKGKMYLRDLGFTQWNNAEQQKHSLIRFGDILTKYYSNLTFSDVKLAFEFLMIGELDEFLPKDRKGNVEKNHFQEFSVEYFTRILNAYKLKRSQVWSKAETLLPRVERTISTQEIKNNRNLLINEIFDAFDNYSVNAIEPDFDLDIHINILIENGLIEIKKPNDESFKTAYRKMILSDFVTRIEKKELMEKFDKNIKTESLKYNAQGIQNNKTIKAYFDSLIKSGKNLKEVLKLVE